jgi:hypothetical protein
MASVRGSKPWCATDRSPAAVTARRSRGPRLRRRSWTRRGCCPAKPNGAGWRPGSCRSGPPAAWPPAASRPPSRRTAAPDTAHLPEALATQDTDVRGRPVLRITPRLSAGGGVGTHQSSGRAAKSRLVFLYHAIPDKGFFHLPCISLKALLCASSPPATISFRWLSCAFITSLAVFPCSGKSHGPPNCLHVVVFISLASFHSNRPSSGTSSNG